MIVNFFGGVYFNANANEEKEEEEDKEEEEEDMKEEEDTEVNQWWRRQRKCCGRNFHHAKLKSDSFSLQHRFKEESHNV